MTHLARYEKLLAMWGTGGVDIFLNKLRREENQKRE